MYEILKPTYRPDTRDHTGNFYVVDWIVVGRADSIEHAKALGFVAPVLQKPVKCHG